MIKKKGRKKLLSNPVATTIVRLSHEGRGIAEINGKTTFISGALPEEKINFRYTKCRSSFDEGEAIDIISPSEKRVTPPCSHFGVCGACSLQHMHPNFQIEHKQSTLLSLLKNTPPEIIDEPLTAQRQGYRRKARLGVKYVSKKEKVFLGFRERNKPFITDITICHTLHPDIGHSIEPLKQLILSLEIKNHVPQLEIAVGDDATAIIVRHLVPLPNNDLEKLIDFFKVRQWHLYLQPHNEESIHRVYPSEGPQILHYYLVREAMEENMVSLRGPSMAHPASILGASRDTISPSITSQKLIFQFHPSQFIQINFEMNQKMVARAIELLNLQKEDNVLDLFCGIGNFSLPIAQHVKTVIGVEGNSSAVQQAKINAQLNQLENTQFYTANLFEDIKNYPWAREHYHKILLDPPRTGAKEIAENILLWKPSRIVYVSCNPATLARDAEILCKQGYHLKTAGIIDMFPHTEHLEAIALFESDE